MAADGYSFAVYRLQDADGVALRVAEVRGLDDAALVDVAIALFKFEQKYEYLSKETTRSVCTFIRHDKRSTKALELPVSESETQMLGQGVTNCLTRAALSRQARGAFMIVTKPGEKTATIGYIEAATPEKTMPVAHLAGYLA